MKYFIVGSDARQQFLYKIINDKNEKVVKYIKEADVVLLPVAQTGRYENDILSQLRNKTIVYGYGFSEEFVIKCTEKRICCMDYKNSEKMRRTNSIVTAEGAIAEAIAMSQLMLQESRCLVIGYGNCGKVIADKLKMLRAKVFILEKGRESRGRMWEVDYIFNTAPELTVTEQMIKQLPEDAVILDIASGGVGVDWQAASRYRIMAKHCPGLPDRYGAKSVAETMYEFISNRNHTMAKCT